MRAHERRAAPPHTHTRALTQSRALRPPCGPVSIPPLTPSANHLLQAHPPRGSQAQTHNTPQLPRLPGPNPAPSSPPTPPSSVRSPTSSGNRSVLMSMCKSMSYSSLWQMNRDTACGSTHHITGMPVVLNPQTTSTNRGQMVGGRLGSALRAGGWRPHRSRTSCPRGPSRGPRRRHRRSPR